MRTPSLGVLVLAAIVLTVCASGALAASNERVFSALRASAADSSVAPGIPLTIPGRDSASGEVLDTVLVLPPVNVDTDRKEISTRSTATSVRLDRSTLQRFAPASTGDALLSAPGVDLIKTGPWSSRLSLRGVSGERVLVMVDGVRLNTGRGHGAQASLVPVARLNEVEVLPGASSAEFGSDAVGGVVNLVTHRSLLTASPSMTVSLGLDASAPGAERGLNARMRLRERQWGLEVGGGTHQLEALVTPDGPVPNSQSRDEDLVLRGMGTLGMATLDAEYSHHAGYDIGLPAFTGDGGAHGLYPLQGRDAQRLELTLAPQRTWWQFRTLAALQTYRSDFDETTVEAILSPRTQQQIATRTNVAKDRVTTESNEVIPDFRLGADKSLRLGGEFRREETSGPRTTQVVVQNMAGVVTSNTTVGSESVPFATRDVAAGSASWSRAIAGTRIELGSRYDWVRSHSDSTADSPTARLDVTDERWSADAGLAQRFGMLEPYGRVATGFRVPNLEERYFRGLVHGGLWVFGNPDLDAERSATAEVGLRVVDASWGDARVSAYRTDVDDFISLTYLGQLYMIPRFQYQNVERARLEGLEVSSRVRVGTSTVAVNAAFPRGRDLDTGNTLADVGSARVTTDVTFPVEHLVPQGTFAVRARWSDAVAAPVEIETADAGPEVFSRPAFWTLSADLGATIAGTRVAFAVRNILDHSYREPLSFIEEPGRTLSISLRRNFTTPLPSR